MCFCVNLNKCRVCDTFFCAGKFSQVCFAQTFATFTHFSYVAILLSKLLVHLCYFAKIVVFVTLFFAQANSLQVCFTQTFCNVYAFFVRCNFIVEIACAFVQILQKSFASEKQSDAKAFCFVGQIVSTFFATVLKFCYRLPDAGHIVCQSSAPASISILSLGEVGLLSPCLTNIIVTKDSITNTVA